MSRPDPRRLELARLRYDLAAAAVQIELIRLRAVPGLSRKYRPDQPREPGGRPGGGRWTADGPSGAAPPAARDDPETTGSIGGGQGSSTREEVVTADGARVLTIRVRSNPRAAWDEQHTVTAPDGARTIIETAGPIQTVRDGETGVILSRTIRTAHGVVPDAFVQQVRGPAPLRPAIARAIEALGTLFPVLSQRNSRDGTAIFEAPASLYEPADGDKLPPIWVGRVSQRELDAACPRNGEVQALADRVAGDIKARGNYASLQDYGNKVHAEIARIVRAMRDPNFVAETSYMRDASKLPKYSRGSLKLDLLEHSSPTTVCVYDHKTGDAGLGAMRAVALAETVQRNFPGTVRMIVIEVRPRP